MSTKEKLEQVLEMLVNEENDKAGELLHDVFVEKAKNIYAELVESDESVEEDVTEEVGGDPEQDLADDISADQEEIEAEEMFSEEDMDDEEAAQDLEASMDAGDEAEAEGAEEVKDAMMNVDDAMAELKSAFAAMTGDEEAPAEDPADAEDEMEESKDESAEAVEETEEAKDESLEEDFEDLEEAASLSAVKTPSDPVGADSGAQKSPVASKNDMGGKAVDIAGSEEKGGNAEKPTDAGGTTEPEMREVKADHKDGTDNSKSPIGS